MWEDMTMAKLTRQGFLGLIATTIIVVTPGFSQVAEACDMHMMHGHAKGGHDTGEQKDQSEHYLKHLLKHAKDIGLTPDQLAKLKAIQLDFKRADVRLEADIKIAQLELEALIEDEQSDVSAIETKAEQLKKAEGAHLIADIKSTRNAAALLTPEQREKDRAHLEHMKSGGGHGGGHGGGAVHGGMMGGGHGQGGGHGSGSSGGQQHQH